MGYRMSFLFVPDPTKLYELTAERDKNSCNWYGGVDSLRNYFEHSNYGGVSFYGIDELMSLVTFPVNDSLYSIIIDDSTTYIAVHKRDTVYKRQRIFDKPMMFTNTQVLKSKNKYICLYNATYATSGNYSRLIIIDRNNIDILSSHKSP